MHLRNYKIKNVQLLRDYENNSRLHSDHQIDLICASIKEYGFTNPILIDEMDNIIAGHARVRAAKKIGIEEVPVLILSDLTDAQKKAYVIADNKIALKSDWDIEILKKELDFLSSVDFNLDLTGFDKQEIIDLFPVDEKIGLIDEDDVPSQADTRVKRGDVWILGDHRLMCGDSTSIDDINNLICNSKIDLIFTDPPYNVKFCGRSGNFEVIKNDDLTEEEFKDFIKQICSVIKILDCQYYIWCNWKFYGLLQSLLDFNACIVWAKNVFGLGNGYRHQHEFCLTNAKIDDNIKNESDLWSVSKDSNYLHPTQKPVELALRALKNHSTFINVCDLFGGSGSTLIAAEKLNKKCFLMELDEKYCDIIITRWENFTGKKAILESKNDTSS